MRAKKINYITMLLITSIVNVTLLSGCSQQLEPNDIRVVRVGMKITIKRPPEHAFKGCVMKVINIVTQVPNDEDKLLDIEDAVCGELDCTEECKRQKENCANPVIPYVCQKFEFFKRPSK